MCSSLPNDRDENWSGSDKSSAVHLYIVVDCKSKHCAAAHVLTYLGEKGKTPARLEYWMSYPLLIQCPMCGETYDYSDAEAGFRQQELPLAPPPKHINRLPLPEQMAEDRY